MSDRIADGDDRRNLRTFVREALVTGTAIVIPVLVTVVVLFVVLDLVSSLLAPLVIPIDRALGLGGQERLLATALAAVLLTAIVLAIGAITESEYGGNRIEMAIDSGMARLPGIGSIYGTLDQVSEMLIESDTDSFQEVVLVEYPEEGSYSVAFKTAEPPEEIATATGGEEDMITVFMPMGPNPVMGGFILYLAPDRVHDVDLTVEEGVSSIVSFGVAIDAEQHADVAGSGVEPYTGDSR
jgi:uncharacterized membrane protein